jgi:hypothetical protein
MVYVIQVCRQLSSRIILFSLSTSENKVLQSVNMNNKLQLEL